MSKLISSRNGFAVLAILVFAVVVIVFSGAAKTVQADDGDKGLGQTSGLLPRENLTMSSVIQVDLDKETVRLPLYKGRANGETVWYVLLDASDEGLADNSGLNFAPKLANLAIGCPECVQTVTLDSPTPAENPFGAAVVNFQGAPDFSPNRVCVPGKLPIRNLHWSQKQAAANYWQPPVYFPP